jgi:hypothetical protein
MDTSQPRFGSAHVIALIALFVALAGTSWAAVKLGKNSVKTKNIASKAVTAKKLANGAVRTEKLAQGAVTNAKVAAGSLSEDVLSVGAREALSVRPGVLPRGYSTKGAYDVNFAADAAGDPGAYAFSFGGSWSQMPQTVFIPEGGGVPASCDGGTVSDPRADPGFLCIFESSALNRNTGIGVPVLSGGFLGVTAAAAGQVRSVGSWAATAP